MTLLFGLYLRVKSYLILCLFSHKTCKNIGLGQVDHRRTGHDVHFKLSVLNCQVETKASVGFYLVFGFHQLKVQLDILLKYLFFFHLFTSLIPGVGMNIDLPVAPADIVMNR